MLFGCLAVRMWSKHEAIRVNDKTFSRGVMNDMNGFTSFEEKWPRI